MSTSPSKPWSLAGRISRGFALTTVALVAAVSITSAVFLRRSVERELHALVIEELHEFTAMFPNTDGSPAAFEELVREYAEAHPTNPMIWRLWTPQGEVLASAGRVRHLEPRGEGPPARLDATRVLEDRFYWRAEGLPDGSVVELAVDGRAQGAFLRRYELYALVLIAGATVVAVLLGTVCARRVSRMLGRVAASVRAVRTPAEEPELDVGDAPEEVRQVADALRDMLHNIRHETEAARLLIAGLAHELRSPIQNLLATTEVVLLSQRDPQRYRSVLEGQLRDLRELGDAIDNLVTLCSAREARQNTEFERFDLGTEAELRLLRERGLAEMRQVRLDVRCSGDLELEGDREALLRAVRNLAANAIEWSPPGGTVDVHLEGRAADVLVTVDDAGPGVPPGERERIFEPFYRAPAAAGRRHGYGLGLALARVAVESHGGDIGVDGSPAGGARFRMRLVRRGGPSGRNGRATHERVATASAG